MGEEGRGGAHSAGASAGNGSSSSSSSGQPARCVYGVSCRKEHCRGHPKFEPLGEGCVYSETLRVEEQWCPTCRLHSGYICALRVSGLDRYPSIMPRFSCTTNDKRCNKYAVPLSTLGGKYQ